MLKRIQPVFDQTAVHSRDDLERGAALELLLLVVFADRVLSDAERRFLESFDDEHPDWDSATFTLQQQLGPATAAVRRALSSSTGIDELVAGIDTRITSPELRAELPRLCHVLAGIDGDVAPRESDVLALIDARFP
jgi:uncharacterized tellurite resistance protein B-like protein